MSTEATATAHQADHGKDEEQTDEQSEQALSRDPTPILT
jgi:hypothetical protein